MYYHEISVARRGSELWDLKDMYYIFSYLATFPFFFWQVGPFTYHIAVMEHTGIKTTENLNSNTENKHLWSITHCLEMCCKSFHSDTRFLERSSHLDSLSEGDPYGSSNFNS